MNDNDITIYDCPKCNGKLIKRTNRGTGEKFLGCTNYPKCKYTEKDQSENEHYPSGVADVATRWE